MRWPWVRRDRLEAALKDARRYKSEVELLRWWLAHEKIEVPDGNEIRMIMYAEVHVSRIPAILKNITAGPTTLELLEAAGKVEDASRTRG